MGQSQSSSGGTSAEAEQPLKRDYYELLSVERTATDEEIKRAYRRKALELHPDRNYGNEEGATRLFAEIQSAYEVLSDPQERAWYDSHRDVLLRGENVGGEDGVPGGDNFAYGSKMTSTDDVLKLMMKFNSRIQFTDAPSGFYGGLKDFFESLAKEEDIAAQWENEESLEYPPFGSENDDYEDIVRPFYAAWNGFATKKSYAWKDKWKLSDAPDRRIRRLMEKENRKLREEAIFEFNDAVRSLVAFVRKRDPRVQNNQRSEAERQKALKDLAAAQAARSRAQREAEIESFSLPEWARSHHQEPDEHAGGFSSEEEEEQHEYECVVCDKIFKSEKQYQTHEKSKKHMKLLKELKRDMKKEGRELDLGHNGSAANMRPAKGQDEEVKDKEGSEIHSRTEPSDGSSDGGVGEANVSAPLERPPVQPQPSASEASSGGDVDSDYAPRFQVEQRLAGAASGTDSDDDISKLNSDIKSSTISVSHTDTPVTVSSDPDLEGSSQPKVGKAKLKRAKKAAAAAATTSASGKSGTSAGSEFRCVVCQGDFTSKTKLFNHIKEQNHAAPVSQLKAGAKSGGGGKMKKR